MSKTIIIDGVEYVPKSELEVEKPKEVKKINTVIRNVFTGKVIFESDKDDIKEALEEYIAKANKKGEIADLSSANLSNVDLSNLDLSNVDFSNADLIRTDFSGSNLTGSNLTNSNLANANLTGSNLNNSNLTGSDLTGSNLTGANLTGCIYYMGNGNQNFEALCKAIKTIKWNDKTGSDFIK